jgi:hypothetical protein
MMESSTKTPAGWATVLLVSFVVLAGCSDRKSEEPEPEPAPQAAPSAPDAPLAPEQPAPTPEKPGPEPTKKDPAPVTPPPATKPEPAKPEPTPAPPAQSPPQKPVVAQPKTVMAKDVVILTGAALGGVLFEHKLHAERAANTCVTCHHASMPQKPATAPQQACSDCHTKAAAPPMKTTYQAAFHNPTAQSGTCIDCHKTENAKGKTTAPLKCMECHKKENR